MGLFLVLDVRNDVVPVEGVGFGSDGSRCGGGAPVMPAAERVGRALDGEEESVDESRDGDDGDEAEDESEGREVYASGRCWERWGWLV